MAATGTIDQLNFEVLLVDDKFRQKVQEDINIAKGLNTSLTEAMNIATRMSSKAPKVNVDTKNSKDALKELNDWYRQLEQADWAKIGKDLNIEPYVAQAISRLKELEQELNTIQSLRKMEGGSGDFYYAEEFRKTKEAADGVLRSMEALKEMDKKLGVEKTNSSFREFIDSLTRTDFELVQMREHFAALEKSPKAAAAYYKELQGTAKAVTNETKTTANVSKDWEAAQRRIAENLAREKEEQKRVTNEKKEGVKASEALKQRQEDITKLIKEGEKGQKKHNEQLKNAHNLMTKMRSVGSAITKLTGIRFDLTLVRRIVSSMIEITGQFEKQKVALATMLQDAQKANEIFEELYNFSSNSVYRFSELAGYAKQLAAFNIASDDVLDTTKRLGDVAAGLGISMDRLILAYGHVKSSGFLRGIQLRSFTQNGVPILDELSKMLTEIEGRSISIGEVFDRMSKREITFEMVEEAFRRMTDEGGKFYNIQEEMAKTLSGQINILKGRWENLLYAYGEKTKGVSMTIVKAMSESISSVDNFERTLMRLVESGSPLYGAIRAFKELFKYLGDHELRVSIKGLGGNTSSEGGEGASGGGMGGGVRGIEEEQKQIVKIKDLVEAIKRDQADITNLRMKASKEGLVIDEKRGIDEEQQLKNLVAAQDENLKRYKEIMGVDYFKETKSAESESEKKLKRNIDKLNAEAAIIEKIRSSYDKLYPYLSTGDKLVDESLMDAVLSSLFGRNVDVSALDSELDAIIVKLKELGEEGQKVAEQLESRRDSDEASKMAKRLKEIEDQQKAIEKYEKTLRKWEKDWGNTYSGLDRKIYDVIADYNDEEKAIEDEYTDAMKEMQEAYGDNVEAIERETEALDKLKKARHEANNASAQEKISNLAKEAVKEARETLNMKDWGDKSFTQVRDIWNGIQDLMKDENFGVSDEILEKVKEAGLSFDEFFKAVEEGYEEMGEETKDEKVKKIIKLSKFAAQQFVKLADSIKELGEASGSGFLTSLGDTVNKLSSSVSNIAQGYATGGPWGVAIASIAEVGKMIINATTEMAKFKEALAAAAEEARVLQAETRLSLGVNTLFGDDEYKSVMNAAKELEDLQKRVDKQREKRYLEEKHWNDGTYRWNTDISLASMAKAVGGELYDEYGNLNAKTLQSILETYGDLSKKSKEWLKEAINDSELYKKAIEQIGTAFESVFGEIAESAASNIVDQWVEAGNAALEYADILDNVARSYAKMLIKSSIIDQVLNEDEANRIAKMFSSGNQSGAMEAIAEDMEKIKAMEPVFADILESFQPYFKGSESSESNSLGSGIKSITEDTAGLLASYINAIRADVSVMRGLQQAGWQNVSAILGFLQSPTLNDHIAQTAANTFDIAQSNMRILTELQSVIRSGSNGGMVVMAEIG